MEWDPNTHTYCRGRPFYQSVGQFIYELERQASLEDTAYGRPPRDTEGAKQNGGKLK